MNLRRPCAWFLVGVLGGACSDTAAPPATSPPPPDDTCPAGLAECDGDPNTVCEARLDSIDHCGSCGIACPADPTKGEAAVCAAGACAIACGPGYEDCNADPADGCEIDTETDPEHCGGCGVEFACGAGVLCELGGCTCNVVVGDLPRQPFSIAIEPEPEGFVYWSLRGSPTESGIQRAPKAGGDAVTIVSGQGPVEAIALWDDQIYWYTREAGGGAIRSVAKASVEATSWTEIADGFLPNELQADALAADEEFLFWTARAGTDGRLMRAKRDGSEAPIVLAGGLFTEVGDITVEGGFVYFTGPYNSDAILRLAVDAPPATTPSVLASAQGGPVGIDVFEQLVYWCNADEIMQLNLETNDLQAIAAGFDTPELPLYVAADATAAYFTSEANPQYGSVLQAVRLANGDVVTLAAAQPGVVDLALDDEHVYWTLQGTGGPGGWSGGAINRCPKLR